MTEERFEERTEPATPRRREEARKRGHVARSGDLSSALLLLAALLGLHFYGGEFLRGLLGSVRTVLENLHTAGAEPQYTPAEVRDHRVTDGHIGAVAA